MKHAALPFVIFMAGLLGCQAGWAAFRVSPMIVSFAPSGVDATKTFILENTGNTKISVQLESARRVVDLDGKESRSPTDEFSIYPQQLTLQAGEKRNVRVTWTGARKPDRELNYRLIISELPEQTQSPRVHFLMQYIASVYITPPGAKPHITVESFKLIHDRTAEIVLHNSGSAHRLLKGLKIFLKTNDGSRTELTGKRIQALEKENILARASRRFQVQIPEALAKAEREHPGTVQAEIDLK